MYKRIAFISFAALILMMLGSATFANEESEPPTIEVVGTAKIMAMPNVATISFSVETNAANAQEAAAKNAKGTTKLMKVLKRATGKEAKLKTSGFSLSPIYEKEKRLHPEGYRVTNTVILETKNLDELGSYIDEASSAGVSRIGRLSFSTDKAEQLRRAAAAEAVRQARKTADDLAKAAGLTIKRIIKVNYIPAGPVRPYRMEVLKARARTPIEIGEIPIEERVTVVFEAN